MVNGFKRGPSKSVADSRRDLQSLKQTLRGRKIQGGILKGECQACHKGGWLIGDLIGRRWGAWGS